MSGVLGGYSGESSPKAPRACVQGTEAPAPGLEAQELFLHLQGLLRGSLVSSRLSRTLVALPDSPLSAAHSRSISLTLTYPSYGAPSLLSHRPISVFLPLCLCSLFLLPSSLSLPASIFSGMKSPQLHSPPTSPFLVLNGKEDLLKPPTGLRNGRMHCGVWFELAQRKETSGPRERGQPGRPLREPPPAHPHTLAKDHLIGLGSGLHFN